MNPYHPDDNHGSVRETGTRHAPKRTGVGEPCLLGFLIFYAANIGIAAKKAILKANKKFGRTIAQASEDIVSITLYAYSPKGTRCKRSCLLVVSNLISTQRLHIPGFQQTRRAGSCQTKGFVQR